jgi:hypothetical protein
MLTELRIPQLRDNIRKDLDLIKEYEDLLRTDTDPRRRLGYRRNIEQLCESLASYQREYDELQKQAPGQPSAEMKDTADLLQRMDSKLDSFLRGQKVMQDDLNDFRKIMLARFDVSEQAIITAIVQRLDRNQLETVQSILDEIETHRVPENELQETLNTIQQALLEIRQEERGLYDSQLVSEAKNLSKVVDDPKLDVNHKLKISVPIIPLILSYETEVELKSGLNLKAAWQGLKARVRG